LPTSSGGDLTNPTGVPNIPSGTKPPNRTRRPIWKVKENNNMVLQSLTMVIPSYFQI
jgi:hypothetical protein